MQTVQSRKREPMRCPYKGTAKALATETPWGDFVGQHLGLTPACDVADLIQNFAWLSSLIKY